jgi:hypothetical protein
MPDRRNGVGRYAPGSGMGRRMRGKEANPGRGNGPGME